MSPPARRSPLDLGTQAPREPFRLRLTLALALLAAATPEAASRAEAPPGVAPGPRMLLVSIDGLAPADHLDPAALGVELANLVALARRGAYASGVSGVLPTVTYPVHTTLVTGLPPRLHGILGNRIFDPLGRSNEAWHWYARELRVPALHSAAYAAGLLVGSIGWPVTVGAELDALVPEIWRSGSDHPADLELLRALSSHGLLDEVEQRLGRPISYPPSDADRTEVALHVLRTRKPHLLLLHLADYDRFQHREGIGSEASRAALESSDRELGRLLDALVELGLDHETLLVVVSDHGFLPVERELRPNTLLREAGLVETDARGRVTRWKALFEAQAGTALLRLADPADRETLERVRVLLEARAADPDSGLRAVLSAPEVGALGGDPEATPLALDARAGFTFANSARGDWSAPTSDRATHGHAPVRPEMEAALIVAGPGLAQTGNLGTVPMPRIGPTLARYLGVELDPRAAAPMDWLLPVSPERAPAP